jgi:hypothetical protein
VVVSRFLFLPLVPGTHSWPFAHVADDLTPVGVAKPLDSLTFFGRSVSQG